jgi:hypothetical protein
MAGEVADQHQDGRREQDDLDARSQRDAHHQVHLTLARKIDRGEVFGGIADQWQGDQAEEELGQAELGGRCFECT